MTSLFFKGFFRHGVGSTLKYTEASQYLHLVHKDSYGLDK